MSSSFRTPWRPVPRVLTSFDRGYQTEADYFVPDRYSFWDDGRCAISRGAGVSYAAASFRTSGAVVDHAHFNRLMDFDSANSILEVEAGTTLGQIFDFAIPKGLFLAVQPGHPGITIGGCIGADVHGKNQFRDGTFISRVESLRLFHPSHGVLDVSCDQHPDLLRLTCGGYGLTGNILSARLRLTKAPSARIAVQVVPLESIADLPELFCNLAEKVDLLYSWHDFNAADDRFGSGFIVTGVFDNSAAAASADTEVRAVRPVDSDLARHLPVAVWNRWSLPLFNRIYKTVSVRWAPNRSISMFDFLFPVARKTSYFQFFGRRGFHECQIVVPGSQFADFSDAIRDYLHHHSVPIALASAKLFRGSRELLRFTGDGICLALDVPRIADAVPLLNFVDELMCECGGWPNLIKDSRLSAEVVARTYPGYDTFRSKLREFDPQRMYRSEMSDRLGL